MELDEEEDLDPITIGILRAIKRLDKNNLKIVSIKRPTCNAYTEEQEDIEKEK